MGEDKPRVLIIGAAFSFPNGVGATARVREYARGLTGLGVDVHVYVTGTQAPGRRASLNTDVAGEWHGVPFRYLCGSPMGERGWLRRRYYDLRGMWRVYREIRRHAKQASRTAVLLYGPELRWILPVFTACRASGAPLIHDRSEWPFINDGEPGALGKLYRRAYCARAFKLFDGVIAISTLLYDYIAPRMRDDAWILRIPIMVDSSVFDCGSDAPSGGVGYAGSLGHTDEVSLLLDAIALLANRNHDATARLMGTGTKADFDFIEETSTRLGIADRIDLIGVVPTEEIPAALCDCAVLALPRFDALFSRAGMPTKLGEYLATARPVVVSDTGDITDYLRPGKDALVVPPGDLDRFADALERALYDPAAQAVGVSGREVARREFAPPALMERVLERLEDEWEQRGV